MILDPSSVFPIRAGPENIRLARLRMALAVGFLSHRTGSFPITFGLLSLGHFVAAGFIHLVPSLAAAHES